MVPKLTIINIAGNEQEVIADCLKSAKFADEIVMVAANSHDDTVKIAKQIIPHIKIVPTEDEYNKNFSKWRNLGLSAATGDWVYYIDSDERITPNLQKEILKVIGSPKFDFYVNPRANYFLGKRVRFGGTYPDYVKRLYRRSSLRGWRGQLHEEPLIKGQPGFLVSDLLHFTHRDLGTMLQKSLVWTDMEAHELLKANHPPVVWWRIFRMMATKFFERLIRQQMWRDGTVGWISGIFETFDTFLIYARLWELQQKSIK